MSEVFTIGQRIEWRKSSAFYENPGEWREGTYEGESEGCVAIADSSGCADEYWAHRIEIRPAEEKDGRITVVNELNDPIDGYVRDEYPGVLVDADHAFYIDAEYKTVVLGRVSRRGSEYVSQGGIDAVGFQLPVDDVAIFDRIADMSATDLLAAMVRRSQEGAA
ncbi:hypothetical protein [Paenibacillus tengchongensis]|uniref:hypothetical protein n=1 Tax=Paenibacillus tengchongensis TaxID=2608684 RepID=UPI00124ECA53|nr:hypothetical protein [Paenibacillus tengchongensis]